MSQTHIKEEIARLKEALLQERHLLLSGQAQETAALMPGKLGAMDELEKAFGGLDAETVPSLYRNDMIEIVQLARENSVHFEAIRHGMRRAIERLESLHSSAYVGSYTQTGGKVAFTEVTGRFVKKA
jgi:tRNA isopentenyl-2-thiomethyl-A-37 hydroxylase MiaE